jgi:hypothetical protein
MTDVLGSDVVRLRKQREIEECYLQFLLDTGYRPASDIYRLQHQSSTNAKEVHHMAEINHDHALVALNELKRNVEV